MEPGGPGRVDRRLAAILAADVAGYSRLIEADEEDTLRRLKALRAEVIDPKIAGHQQPRAERRQQDQQPGPPPVVVGRRIGLGDRIQFQSSRELKL